MVELIACLSLGKGTWASVSRLLSSEQWDKIYLLTNDFGIQNFQKNAQTELLLINDQLELVALRDQIKQHLKERIKGMEVAVNFLSGSGKEHMALVAALLQLGVAIHLVHAEERNLEEI